MRNTGRSEVSPRVGLGCPGQQVSETGTERADLASSPVWGENEDAEDRGGACPVLISFQRGPALPAGLGKPHAPLGLTCFEHSPLFSLQHRDSLSLQLHCPFTLLSIPGLLPWLGWAAPGGLLLQVRELNPCLQSTA